MRRSLLAGFVVSLLTVFAQDALAASITFDFEDQSTVSNPQNFASVVSTQSGLTATLTREDATALEIWNLAVYSGPASWLNRSVGNFNQPWSNPAATMIINFSAPITSGSIELGDFGGDDDGTVTLTAFSGLGGTGSNLGSVSVLYPVILDIGVSDADVRSLSVSSAGILSLVLTSNGSVPGTLFYDNLRVDTSVAAVPEPATLTLFGLGLAGLARSRARRSRNA